MELSLKRKVFGETFTEGELWIDGEFFCYTVEDRCIDWSKEKKVPGQTAIPVGRYKVIINLSARFKKELPLLLEVPQFQGIRIHSGNSAKDSEGCILVGLDRLGVADGYIGRSRDAMKALMLKLKAAKGGTWVTITEDR